MSPVISIYLRLLPYKKCPAVLEAQRDIFYVFYVFCFTELFVVIVLALTGIDNHEVDKYAAYSQQCQTCHYDIEYKG